MLFVRIGLLGLTLLVTLFLGLCDDGDEDVSDEDARDYANAIATVATVFGDSPSDIPVFAQDYDCTIFASGPQASLITPVEGRCFYDAEKQDQQWLVTFRETWFCDDFAADASGHPPCVGLTGFHEWEYAVDLRRGSFQLLDDSGQFAPDMIR